MAAELVTRSSPDRILRTRAPGRWPPTLGDAVDFMYKEVRSRNRRPAIGRRPRRRPAVRRNEPMHWRFPRV